MYVTPFLGVLALLACVVAGIVIGAIAHTLVLRDRERDAEKRQRALGRRGDSIHDVMSESSTLPTEFELDPLVWGTEIQDDIDRADADEREGIMKGTGAAGNEH